MKLESSAKGRTLSDSEEAQPLPGVRTESWLKPHPKFSIRRIAVPLDFSEPSYKALQYAVAIAREFGAELVLVHAIQAYPAMPELPVVSPQLKEILRTEATQRLESVAKTIREIPCQTMVCMGYPAREIVYAAKKAGADLIVISTHGRTGLAHVFLGSVAEQVVRMADCPVTVVRADERDFITIAADDAELNRVGIAREVPDEPSCAIMI